MTLVAVEDGGGKPCLASWNAVRGLMQAGSANVLTEGFDWEGALLRRPSERKGGALGNKLKCQDSAMARQGQMLVVRAVLAALAPGTWEEK